MILYPNAKLNIGLSITEKRNDGFHNLETIFYPIALCDELELLQTSDGAMGVCHFEGKGIPLDCEDSSNLVIKAYELLLKDFVLPGVQVVLNKKIPFGAGLGGGSADAAFMLKGLNTLFQLSLSTKQLETYASKLGSDCALFIKNQCAFGSGRGDVLTPLALSLKGYELVLVKPECSVSTAEAYRGIVPKPASFDLHGLANIDVSAWKDKVVNDFEENVFKKYEEVETIKADLYKNGAVFAQMSGSGTAVFGLFSSTKGIDFKKLFSSYYVHTERL